MMPVDITVNGNIGCLSTNQCQKNLFQSDNHADHLCHNVHCLIGDAARVPAHWQPDVTLLAPTVNTPRILDNPVRSGSGGVVPNKLNAVIKCVVRARATALRNNSSIVAVPVVGVDANGKRTVGGQGCFHVRLLLGAASATLARWDCILVVCHLGNMTVRLALATDTKFVGSVWVVRIRINATITLDVFKGGGEVTAIALTIGGVA